MLHSCWLMASRGCPSASSQGLPTPSVGSPPPHPARVAARNLQLPTPLSHSVWLHPPPPPQVLTPAPTVKEAMSNVLASRRNKESAAEQGEADKVRPAHSAQLARSWQVPFLWGGAALPVAAGRLRCAMHDRAGAPSAARYLMLNCMHRAYVCQCQLVADSRQACMTYD